MKRIFFFLSVIAAACTLFFSCQRQEENQPAARSEIQFSASVGTFTLKATDNALETGDVLGVYARGTTRFDNCRLVWNGKSLVPDTPVYWDPAQGENEICPFVAYYPYQEAMGEGFVFSVQDDQSTHAAYTASDFMMAYTEASPADGTVNFQLYHTLSKIIIRVDNKLGLDIADIYMGGVYRHLAFTADASDYIPSGDPEMVKAGKVTLADGSTAWVLIVIPGDIVPSLTLTTTDGQTFNYQVKGGVRLFGGCCYTADVTLSETEELVAEFTVNVNDWWYDSEVWFNDKPGLENENWSIIGTIEGTGWDVDFPMYYNESDRVWYLGIAYHVGEEFKFRSNSGWQVNLGLDYARYEESKDDFYASLMQDGDNIKLPSSGYWWITLNRIDNCIKAFRMESYDDEGMAIDGSFSDWDAYEAIPGEDAVRVLKMAQTSDKMYFYLEVDNAFLQPGSSYAHKVMLCFDNGDNAGDYGDDAWNNARYDRLIDIWLTQYGMPFMMTWELDGFTYASVVAENILKYEFCFSKSVDSNLFNGDCLRYGVYVNDQMCDTTSGVEEWSGSFDTRLGSAPTADKDMAVLGTLPEQGTTVLWSRTLSEIGVPAAYNRLAYKTAGGDALLVSDGERVHVLNPANGDYWKNIQWSNVKPTSICSDDAGNLVVADDIPFNVGTHYTIYYTANLNDDPVPLIEHDADFSGTLGSIRVRGDLSKQAVVTGFVGATRYWTGWEINNFAVSMDNYYAQATGGQARGAIAVDADAWSPQAGAVMSLGPRLNEGIVYRAYDTSYALYYLADAYTPAWVGSGSYVWQMIAEPFVAGNENPNNMDIIDYQGRRIIAFTQGAWFSWGGNRDVYFLDVTNPEACKVIDILSGDSLAAGQTINADYPYADVKLHVEEGMGLVCYVVNSAYDSISKVLVKI